MQKRFSDNYNVKVDAEKELSSLFKLRERLLDENMITDTVVLLHKALNDQNKRILFEGANATMLDIDFGLILFIFIFKNDICKGTYPYTTSSSTNACK